MDNEQSNSSPSAAAAVADRVSSAAKPSKSARFCSSSSTMANPLNNTAATNNIRLLIKASSQQFEDMTIESDLLWTVKRLKAHLSLVYPGKPSIDDQKLIYSGQLLKDNHLLKDIIRNYKDVYTQNHVIHLVCSVSNNVSLSSSSTSTSRLEQNVSSRQCSYSADGRRSDGLRHRNVIQSIVNNTQSSHQPLLFPPINNATDSNFQSMSNQQLAMYNWLQQVYHQYMQESLRTGMGINIVESSATNSLSQAIPSSVPSFSPQIMFSNMMSQEISTPMSTSTYQVREQTTSARIAVRDANAAVPAPMAAAAPFPAFDQDDMNNSDWFDTLFCVIRLMLFLTIFYFNFSPVRCIIAITIAISIYSYHTRFRRVHNVQDNNNTNRNINTAVVVDERETDDSNVNPPSINTIDSSAVRNESIEENRTSSQTSTPAENENNTNSNPWIFALAFFRTFVVSFFTSLLPDAPAL